MPTIDEHQQQIVQLTTDLTALQALTSQLDATATKHGEHIETNSRNIEQINSFNADISKTLEKIKHRLESKHKADHEELVNQINEIKKQINDAVTLVDQRDNQTTTTIQQLDSQTQAQVQQINTTLGEHRKAIDANMQSTTKAHDELVRQHSALKGVVTEQGTAMTELQKLFGEFERKMSDTTTEFQNNVSKEFDEMKLGSEALNRSTNVRVEQIEAIVKATKGDIEDLRREMAEQSKADAAANTAALENVQNQSDEFKTEIRRIQEENKTTSDETLGQLRDAIEQKFKRNADRVKAIQGSLQALMGDNGKDLPALVAQLDKLEKQITDNETHTASEFVAVRQEIASQHDDLNTQIAGFDDKISVSVKALKDEMVPKIDADIARTRSEVDTTINELSMKLDELRDANTQSQQDTKAGTDKLADEIKLFKANINDQLAQTNQSTQDTSEKITRVLLDMETLTASVQQQKTDSLDQAKTLNGSIQQSATDLTATIEANNKAQNDNVKAMKQELANQLQTISDAQLIIDGFRVDIEDCAQNINAISTKVDKQLEANKGSAAQSVESKLQDVNTRLASIDKQITVIQGADGLDLPSIQQNIASLRQKLNENDQTYQKELASIHDEITAKVSDAQTSAQKGDDDLKAAIQKLVADSSAASKQSVDALSDHVNSTNIDTSNTIKQIQSTLSLIVGEDKISLASIVTDLRNLNSQTEKKLNDMTDHIDLIQTGQAESRTSLQKFLQESAEKNQKEIKATSEALHKKIADLTTHITKVENENISKTNKMISDIDRIQGNKQYTIESAIAASAEVQTKLNEAQQQLQSRINGVESSLTTQQSAVRDELNRIKGDSKETLPTIVASIQTLQTTLEESLANQSTTASEAIEKLKADQKTLRQDHQELSLSAASTKKDLDQLSADITSQIATIHSEISDSTNNLTAKIAENSAANEKRREKLLNKIDARFKQTVEDDANQHAAISAKIDEITQQIEGIHGSSFDSIATKDEMAKSERAMQEAIQKESTALTAKFNAQINDINTQVKAAKTEGDDSLKKTHQELVDKLGELETQLQGVVGPQKTSLPIVIGSIENLRGVIESRLAAAETATADLDKKLTNQITDANEQRKTGDSEISASLNQLKETTDAQFAEIQKSIAANSETAAHSVKAVDSKLAKMAKTQQAEVLVKFDEITATVNTNRTEADESSKQLRADIDDLNQRLAASSAKSKSELETVSAFQTAELSKQIANVRETAAQTKSELGESIQQVAADLQKKDDTLNALITSVQTESKADDAELLQQLERSSGIVSDTKSQLEKRMKDNDVNIQQLLADLQTQLTTVKQARDALEQKQASDVLKLKQDQTESLESTNAAIDHINQNLTKENEKLKTRLASIEAELKEEIEKATTTSSNALDKANKLNTNITQAMNESLDSIRKDRDAFVAQTNQQMNELSDRVHQSSNSFNSQILPRFEEVEKTIQQNETKQHQFEQEMRASIADAAKQRTEADTTMASFQSVIDQTVKGLSLKIASESDRVNDCVTDFKQTSDDVIKQTQENQANMSAISERLDKLLGIEQYNKELHEYGENFGQMVTAVENHYSYVCGLVQTVISGQTTDPEVEKDAVRDALSAPAPRISRRDEVLLEGIAPDVEIGSLIRRSLKINQRVRVEIPEDTRVSWDIPVSISPNQSLTITGANSDTSVIQMKGVSTFGGVSEASRALVDGTGALRLRNLRIEARCGVAQTEASDKRALFVVRGLKAKGQTRVLIASSRINSDRPVVNIAGNALAAIDIVSSALANVGPKKDSVVTVFSAGAPKGYGLITKQDAELVSNFEWNESPNLLISE